MDLFGRRWGSIHVHYQLTDDGIAFLGNALALGYVVCKVVRRKSGLAREGISPDRLETTEIRDLRADLQAAGCHDDRLAHPDGTPAGLTKRQVQVLICLYEGLSNAEIANKLFISPKTVDHHVLANLAKLGVRTRAKAV